MTYQIKKKFSYILVGLMILFLVSCGSTSSEDDSSDKTRREDWGETTEVSEEDTEVTTEEITTEATTAKAEVASPDNASQNKDSQDKDSQDNASSDKNTDDTSGDEDDNISNSDESDTTASTVSTGGKLIVLDPGHSNVVTGNTEPLGPGSGEMKAADSTGTHGVSSGLSEIELNFQVATKLKTELEARGYTVIMTRYDNDTAISCSERAQIANNAGADAFIRIHADGSESSSSSGAMAICITPSNPYTASTYSASRKLSDAVLNAYVASTGFSSRGVWETDTMTGNNWSNVPCTLIEMGFMTNPNEDTLMADASFQQKIVTGIANGIDNYFAN